MVTEACLWITFQECKAIFGKSNGGVNNAILKRKIKARHCAVGSNWMIEYYSCIAWGWEIVNHDLVREILSDVKS